MLQNSFGLAAKLSVKFLKGLLGWTKTAVSTGGGIVSSVFRTIGTALLSVPGLLKKLFVRATPVFMKTQLTKAWGLAKLAAAPVGRIAWRLLLFSSGSIMSVLASAGGVVGSVWAALGLGPALAAIGYVAFWGLVIAAVAVTALWIANWITNKVFQKGIGDAINDYIDGMGEWTYRATKAAISALPAGIAINAVFDDLVDNRGTDPG